MAVRAVPHTVPHTVYTQEQRAQTEARFYTALHAIRAQVLHEQCELIDADLPAQHKVELIVRLHALVDETARSERQSMRLLASMYPKD